MSMCLFKNSRRGSKIPEVRHGTMCQHIIGLKNFTWYLLNDYNEVSILFLITQQSNCSSHFEPKININYIIILNFVQNRN